MNHERDERRFQCGITGPDGPITNRELAERICNVIGTEIEEIDEFGAITAIIDEGTYEMLESQIDPMESGLIRKTELDNVEYEFEIPGI